LSLPNVFLNVVAAIITTKIGPVKAMILYCGFLVTGQTLIAYAVYSVINGWYTMMLIGRVLIGFAGYSLTGASLALVPKFTEPKLVAFLVGIAAMLPWSGDSFTTLLSPIIY
jgi:MFS family permease